MASALLRHDVHTPRRPFVLFDVRMVNPRWRRAALSAARWLRSERGWVTRLLDAPHRLRVRDLAEPGCIGAIVADLEPALLRRRARLPRPVVILDGLTPATARFPIVAVDEDAVGACAAQHLLERGLRDLFVVRRRPARPVDAVRCAGFLRIATAAGAHARTLDLTMGGNSHRTLGARLRALPRPCGIFAGEDIAARLVTDAAEAVGLAVPNDLAVLGMHNNPIISEIGSIELSSIITPDEALGRTAMELLCALADGGKSQDKQQRTPLLLAPISVAMRSSTDIDTHPDPLVRDALRCIRRGACGGLDTDHLARQLSVGRRMLERRLRAAIGAGPALLIRRARIERARELIAQDELELRDVATRCGFADAAHLNNAFRSIVGETPAAWGRRQRG